MSFRLRPMLLHAMLLHLFISIFFFFPPKGNKLKKHVPKDKL